jgi:hypothetical protein
VEEARAAAAAVSFKDPFEIPNIFKDPFKPPMSFKDPLKPLMSFKDPIEIPNELYCRWRRTRRTRRRSCARTRASCATPRCVTSHVCESGLMGSKLCCRPGTAVKLLLAANPALAGENLAIRPIRNRHWQSPRPVPQKASQQPDSDVQR